MSGSEIERTLVRLAHQIVEKNNGVENLVLVGIKRRGVPLASRLAALIQQIEKTPVPVGTLGYHSVSRRSLHRGRQPGDHESHATGDRYCG